ncbi:response regulator [Flavivirga rizhaonensis]|uniref:Response regulator transcription factor n=1 Tax=Flavivirga rizhaonensis TaxID=2559571 RepID=A0A4S1DTD7_9FLAO|nr:response regulator [Flavivirga rizhaonensis]TGV01053.1 response regulator transcription factor [Flavivirga rizhaonensis]
MKSPCRVLIIDDHPLITDVYKGALQKTTKLNKTFKFSVDVAHSCDTAVLKINEAAKKKPFDIVFLDIRIPASKDNKILGGEDLGILIRKRFKNIKIIVSTSYDDSYMISCILKNINPEAYVTKGDLTIDILNETIKTVILDPPYYSKTVMKILRKQSANDFVIDNIDRKILYELSNGTKMNELPNVLPLSIAALERRKRILKDVFNVEGKGDRDLLQLAHEKGFI